MTKRLFLLRGLVRESRHWGDVPSILKSQLPEFDVITPNIPGVGQYYQQPSPNNFDEMIHFIRDQYKTELSQGENTILAMSLGGMMAKRWSEIYPKDFQKMILVNTSYKGINPLYKRIQPSAMLSFLKLFFTFDIEKRELGIIKLISNATHRYQDVHRLWLDIQKSAPVSKKSFINQVTAALTFNPDKSAPKPKLLILAGAKDRLCSVECSKKLHELWAGDIYIHPAAGHDIPIDDPNWFVDQVKNFLQE